MTQSFDSPECVAAARETDDGWAYSCLCGFESRPGFAKPYAEKLARLHERARGAMIDNQ